MMWGKNLTSEEISIIVIRYQPSIFDTPSKVKKEEV